MFLKRAKIEVLCVIWIRIRLAKDEKVTSAANCSISQNVRCRVFFFLVMNRSTSVPATPRHSVGNLPAEVAKHLGVKSAGRLRGSSFFVYCLITYCWRICQRNARCVLLLVKQVLVNILLLNVALTLEHYAALKLCTWPCVNLLRLWLRARDILWPAFCCRIASNVVFIVVGARINFFFVTLVEDVLLWFRCVWISGQCRTPGFIYYEYIVTTCRFLYSIIVMPVCKI